MGTDKTSVESVSEDMILEVPRGCPVCRGTVKGNDKYRYFCKSCNLLFTSKDVIGRGGRKTRMTDEDREALLKKRKELTEKVKASFQEKPRQVEEDKEEAVLEKEEPVEEEKEIVEEFKQEPTEEEAYVEAEETPEENEEAKEETTQEEMTEPEKGEEKEEYELESQDKIIASSQSTKMHSGSCHFVKKIHPHNRIYLDSIEQGRQQGYESCVCLRRQAKQR